MEAPPSFRHFGPNPSKRRPRTKFQGGVEDGSSFSLPSASSYAFYPSTCHVPQTVEDGWQPTAHSAPSVTMAPEGPHDFGFALHPVASGRDPEVMATTEEWGDQPSWKTGADLALMPIHGSSFSFSVTGHGSSSTQQAGQKPYTGQQIVTRRLDDPEQYAGLTTLHPAMNATATPSDPGNTIQETENILCAQPPIHRSADPEWLQPFNEWLPTRRQQMSVQGLGDPTLCPFVWIRVFGGWLQLRQLLSSQGFGDLPVRPRCWDEVFDVWLQRLLEPNTPGLDNPNTSIYPTLSALSLATLLTTPQPPDVGSSCSTPPARKDRKRILDVVSRFTPQDIQEACRKNGVEESVIARIPIVFPDIVSRVHLMLVGRRGNPAGDRRDHRGYMEFAGRRMVDLENVKGKKAATGAGQVQRYYCKLCGPGEHPRWKNSKDLLVHVWDTHCDPQGDGE